MQVPHSMDTEVQAEMPVRKNQGVSWGGDTETGGTERMRDNGGAYNERSYPHADKDTAEIFRVAGGGMHQGEERDICGAEIRREEEVFQRTGILGEGIFRLDGGS